MESSFRLQALVEGKAEIARNLKQLGVLDETIAQATGLSLNEIKHLAEQ
ncbi:MAG: hypothetical protein LBC20_11175 [Planctomycetaceae bacterium]|jgi:SOS response regulatory protein OraA/RecX|nr:hypothetical protein [Planctomycetaceae bacterium]